VFISNADGDWVTAESLSVGDEVIASDGTTGRISALERINEPQMMYNLSVAVVATYLVGEGRWVVWVYNGRDVSRPYNVLANESV